MPQFFMRIIAFLAWHGRRAQKIRERGGRVGSEHEVFADEESVKAGSAQAKNIIVGAQAGFTERDTIIGNVIDQLEGRFRANSERFQVAIVYAEDAGVGRECAAEFGF